MRKRPFPRDAGVTGAGAYDEKKLPSERIEVPDAVGGISRQSPPLPQCQDIENCRGYEGPDNAPLERDQHQRKNAEKRDVERQDIEESRLKLQQQRLDDGDVRLLKEIGDAQLFCIDRIVDRQDGIGDFGGEDDEQEDVGDVELPNTAVDLRRREERAPLPQAAAINEGCGVAGNEDEYLGRVGKGERAQGEIGKKIVRNMIDEDEEQ